MAFVLYLTFLFVLQITIYHTEAMPTVYVPNMPENCRNQTFCTSDTEYPQEIVDRLMKEKNLSFSISVNPNKNYPTEIGNRQGAVDIYPCKAEHERRKDIRYIIDEHNNVRIVAQSLAWFRQLIPIVKCKSPKPTNDFNMAMTDLVNSYNNIIECVESKLDFNFVVLSPDMTSLELARVINGGVPVGCQCRYVE